MRKFLLVFLLATMAGCTLRATPENETRSLIDNVITMCNSIGMDSHITLERGVAGNIHFKAAKRVPKGAKQ